MAARSPMAIQSNHHDHWIDGNPNERVLVLAIIAMANSNGGAVTYRNVVLLLVTIPSRSASRSQVGRERWRQPDEGNQNDPPIGNFECPLWMFSG